MKKKTKKDVSAEVVLASIEKKAAPLVKKLQAMQIESQDDYELAGKRMKIIKTYVKEAEAQRKDITDDLSKVVRKVNALFKPFKDKMFKLETMIKARMLEWHQEVEENKQAMIEAYEQDEPLPRDLKNAPVDNSSRYSGSRSIDEYIYNIKEIPAKYLLPNEPAIKAAIKAGKRVPGVKVRQKPIIVI